MLLVHLEHRSTSWWAARWAQGAGRVVNDEATRDPRPSRGISRGRGTRRRDHPTSANPQAQSSLNTRRPVTGCAGHMKLCAAPSASIRHTITRGCRPLLRAEIPFLADTAVFDRIWLPFIVRVVPSKYASVIGPPFIFYVHIMVSNKSRSITYFLGQIRTACPARERHDGRRMALRGCAEKLQSGVYTSKTVGR